MSANGSSDSPAPMKWERRRSRWNSGLGGSVPHGARSASSRVLSFGGFARFLRCDEEDDFVRLGLSSRRGRGKPPQTSPPPGGPPPSVLSSSFPFLFFFFFFFF